MSEIQKFAADLQRRLSPYLEEDKVLGHVREATDHLKSAQEDGISPRKSLGTSRQYANRILQRLVEGPYAVWFRFLAILWPWFAMSDVVWRPFTQVAGGPLLDPQFWLAGFGLVFFLAFFGCRAWTATYGVFAVTLTLVGALVGGFLSSVRETSLGMQILPHSANAFFKPQVDVIARDTQESETKARDIQTAFAGAQSEADLPAYLRQNRKLWNAGRWQSEVSSIPVSKTFRGTFAEAKAGWAKTDLSHLSRAAADAKADAVIYSTERSGFDSRSAQYSLISTALVSLLFFVLQVTGGFLGSRARLFNARSRNWANRA